MTNRGTGRLLGAAVLCLLALGLTWRSTVDFGLQGYYSLPSGYLGADGYYYTDPGYVQYNYEARGVKFLEGFRTDARVGLVPAAVAFGWAAFRRTPASRRAARAAVVAAGVLLLVAATRGRVQAVATMAAVLALAGPVAWPGRRSPLGRRAATGGAGHAGGAAALRLDEPPATGSAF